MEGKMIMVCLLLLGLTSEFCFAANVTYDHRALVIDGQRKLLVSGSIHYPRSTPDMWPGLIQKAKDGGLNMIQTYVFWDLHEPIRGQYDFSERKDLVRFVKLIGEAGLYVHLRIGPYVCAEWNYGGFPLWLHFVPGIVFRTDNEPFKAEMHRFTTRIVDMMKRENLYASQGGPIILSQIENEYGNIQKDYGPSAKPYVQWAASMAISLDTGVPWVMCRQDDSPDPIINTCNGYYCDSFTPNSKGKPKMWTENWSGWPSYFGDPVPYRPTEDLAFAVARFYQLGGTFMNYYMYHGGTNFGRTSGGPFITTSYDYDAPLNEYGLPSQPKYGHLRDVHKAIKLCEEAILAADPNTTSLGQNLEATFYRTDSGLCAAFLANTDNKTDATVNFTGTSYNLPAWSVSILPDCKNVNLNTAKINSMTSTFNFKSQSSKYNTTAGSTPPTWMWISEPVGISTRGAFRISGLVEQINTTADTSDYLWYSTSTRLRGYEKTLHVESLGHALHAFINGKHAGSVEGSTSNNAVQIEVPVTAAPHRLIKIDLLSLTVGLQNYGAYFDKKGAGVTGPVQLKGSENESTIDLSHKHWTYQIGLRGERLGFYSGSSSHWVPESSRYPLPTNKSLIWYRTIFDAPSGNSAVAIDLTGMGKGQAWVNGKSIGRYWLRNSPSNGGCTDACNYRGTYDPKRCLKKCGQPSQNLYHVPRSWVRPLRNILVLFEETGGNPMQISSVTIQAGKLCAHVSESHSFPVDMWKSNKEMRKEADSTVSLHCPFPDQVISRIGFASFGNPHGKCGSFHHGECRSKTSLSVVQKACLGKSSCSIGVSVSKFGNPCANVTKSLAVEASCS